MTPVDLRSDHSGVFVRSVVDSQEPRRRSTEDKKYEACVFFGTDPEVKDRAQQELLTTTEYTNFLEHRPESSRRMVDKLDTLYPLVPPIGKKTKGWGEAVVPTCLCKFHLSKKRKW